MVLRRHEVLIALGANIGNRIATLARAVARLEQWLDEVAISRLYVSAPAYVEDQPAFHNMALGGTTELAPFELLDLVLGIEQALGRVRLVRYGPRQVDIDIIYYDALRVETPTLTIPHPLRAERRFVLAPLADIAPDRRDPVTGQTIRAMLDALPATGGCAPVGTLAEAAAAAPVGFG